METRELWVLDGGMGRELARRGAPFRQPEWSALALMEAPETVREVHQAYVASGARVITTNSYALVPFHIGDERFFAEGEGLANWPVRWLTIRRAPCRWRVPCRRCLALTAPTCSRRTG